MDKPRTTSLPDRPRPTVSVVIPVYRAEKTLLDLYSQLSAAMSQVASAFEIIFVEDGGGDGSWPIIVGLAGEDDRVRGIRLSRNYGQHSALLCGIRAAKQEVVLTMDDDLQHPVSEIAPMLAALTPEFDVVYGAPLEEHHGFLRDLASRLTKMALTSAMGAETARNVSAFRAFRTRLREGFQDYRSPWVSIDVLLTWATSRFAAIKVRHAQRAAGISGYTPRKLIRHALNLMTGFSTETKGRRRFPLAFLPTMLLCIISMRRWASGSPRPASRSTGVHSVR